MKHIFIALAATVISVASFAQNPKEEILSDYDKAGGLYYAYPGPQKAQTPAPRGYKAFYISHFGRHGSRWLDSSDSYDNSLSVMRKASEAGVLTDLGKDVLARLEAVCADAAGHVGELSPLGVQQHKGIASRMYASFPKVFRRGAVVTANSTQYSRVIMSMFSFCDKLKELNPKLEIKVNASVRDEAFVANRTDASRSFEMPEPYRSTVDSFRKEHCHPERVMNLLFKDAAYLSGEVDSEALYGYLLDIAAIMQNTPSEVRFYDLFTADELYDFWQLRNLDYYISKGPNPVGGDVLTGSALPMLDHVIKTADEVISAGSHGATLRFSHDSYLVPLAVCLQLDGCRGKATDPDRYSAVFTNYKISPMCGNIQLVFFKNRKDDVLVKFLLNENEVGIPAKTDFYPYYRWEDVKQYYGNYYHRGEYGYDHSLEASGGLLRTYPEPDDVTLTPAPKGYKPFYIGHLGRHGSRWHTRSAYYDYALQILEDASTADVLTPLGQDVLGRMRLIHADADRHAGELTPLGFRQHAGIAQRMYRNFPEVFRKGGHVYAKSTTSVRVMLSMNSFCETLRELNPKLDIEMETGKAVRAGIGSYAPEATQYAKNKMWEASLDSFKAEMFKPERLVASLFTDASFVSGHTDPVFLMDVLFEIASDLPDTELDVRLYDIFTEDELNCMWKYHNYEYYMSKGPNLPAGDSVLVAGAPMLKDFIVRADKAVAGDPDADVATLRFSHDSYLTPLTTTFRFSGCRERTDDPMEAAQVWSTSKVSPMAGNIQMILFRNRKGDVIVKFLHNEHEVDIPLETDIYPYYHWTDVRNFYNENLNLGL